MISCLQATHNYVVAILLYIKCIQELNSENAARRHEIKLSKCRELNVEGIEVNYIKL